MRMMVLLLALATVVAAEDAALGRVQEPRRARQELPHAWPRDGATRLFENERVFVWDVTWLKGKPSPMHRHRYDLVAVFLAGSPIRVTEPDGAARESTVNRGHVAFQARGVTHAEEGLVDTNPRHAIMIDLKDHAVAALPNASGYPAAFPREGAQRLLENDRVVVWDYTWTRGKPTPMFQLLASDDQQELVILADGLPQVEERLVQVERVAIRRAGRSQLAADDAALQLAKHPDTSAEAQVSAEEIPLQEIAVGSPRSGGGFGYAKAFGPEAEFTAERERPVFRAKRDVLDRVPEVALRDRLQKCPVLVRGVRPVRIHRSSLRGGVRGQKHECDRDDRTPQSRVTAAGSCARHALTR